MKPLSKQWKSALKLAQENQKPYRPFQLQVPNNSTSMASEPKMPSLNYLGSAHSSEGETKDKVTTRIDNTYRTFLQIRPVLCIYGEINPPVTINVFRVKVRQRSLMGTKTVHCRPKKSEGWKFSVMCALGEFSGKIGKKKQWNTKAILWHWTAVHLMPSVVIVRSCPVALLQGQMRRWISVVEKGMEHPGLWSIYGHRYWEQN